MNERIFNMAQQAGAVRWHGEQNGNTIDFTPTQLEKFAEMLVQECIEIVEPCKCGCCQGEPEGIIADVIIKQIKDHFGVTK